MSLVIKKQSGLSLVELMISITLGLILMTGVVQMFLSSKESFSSQQGISRIQETGRLAIEFMTRDIRQAGTFGCSRTDAADPFTLLQNDIENFGGLHNSFNDGIRGYPAAANLPNGAVADLGMAAVNPNENIVVIRYAQDLGLAIAQATTPNDIVVQPNGAVIANNCIAGICVDNPPATVGAAVVTDCYNGTVIRVAALNLNAGLIRINHANPWKTQAGFNYKTGFVAPLSTVVYFIADSAGAPAGRPSLYKRVNRNPPEEVLEGVERMSVTYAIGVNNYVNAATITAANNWPNVTSVRLELVVRSIDNYVVDQAAPYMFAGVQQIPVNAANGDPDRYLRQVFSTTVDLRSR